MKKGQTNPSRLHVWGDSRMNKLPSASRKQRKRQASKRRRSDLRKEDGEL